VSEQGFSKREWQDAYRKSQADLTAAQQRVAELEGCQAAAMLMRETALKDRVAELEQQNANMLLTIQIARDACEHSESKLTADNARLRELLQRALPYLPRVTLDGNGIATMGSADLTLYDDFKAAIGEGE